MQKTIGVLLYEASMLVKRIDAEVLLSHVLSMDKLQMLLSNSLPVSDFQYSEFLKLLQRRQNCEPIAYCIGYKEFWGRDFFVTPATLIPRPDTECIIELAIAQSKSFENQPIKILDLGTGSGCIPITLLCEIPLSKATSCDISAEALSVARKNAQALGVIERINFVQSNWFSNLDDKYDIITANPPYIDESAQLMPDVLNFEPHSALFAEDKGLQHYRSIAKGAKSHLKPDGAIIIEVGYDQATSVTDIFQQAGFTLQIIKKDIANIDRALLFMLT